MMLNFEDPAVIAADIAALKKFLCVIDGFFIWEFISTLGYELDIIRGHLRFRWSIWLYSLTRVATLAMVVINLFYFDATTPDHCRITMVSQFASAYLALASSSLLIVLRIIAIWDKNMIIVVIATGTWGTKVGFLVQGIWGFRVTYGDEYCVGTDLASMKLGTIASLVTDVILLSIMLVGLFHVRHNGGRGTMTLGRLLWNQGIMYLVVTVLVEVTPLVFICLDINEPFNLALQIPWVVTMSIVASRMYRSLSEFLSSDISQKTEKSDSTSV